MSEFGHSGTIGSGFCIDSWGVGPFVITVDGNAYRFEDSDRFGPALIKRNGDLTANPYPGERSPFWRAHTSWRVAGRRLGADGVTCIWDEPRPTIIEKRGRDWFVVEHGDDHGPTIKRVP